LVSLIPLLKAKSFVLSGSHCRMATAADEAGDVKTIVGGEKT